MTNSFKYMLGIALILAMLLPFVSAATEDMNIKVVDKEGDGIKSAVVKVWVTGNTSDTLNGCEGGTDKTDSSGEITCDNAEDNEDYSIEVTHSEYKDFSNTKALKDWDKSETEIVVVMRPEEFSLEITVEDDSGDGVKGADVTIESLDEDLDEADFDGNFDIVALPDGSSYDAFEYDEDDTTDSDGVVTFDDLEYNTVYEVTLEKSGYITTVTNVTFQDDADDDDVTLTLVKPGTATYTATVKDQDGKPVSGAIVRIVGLAAEHSYSGTTGADGSAVIVIYTPETYDIAVTKEGYSTATQDDLKVSTGTASKVFTITSQNKPPVANAGQSTSVLIGATVQLDGSGSNDPDSDPLTYSWSDSLGTVIPSVVSPAVVFDVAGVHVINLTVSDGTVSDTAEVTVTVETLQNCGDGICSLAEQNAAGTNLACPKDCPICRDAVNGAGENDPESSFYCPVDWNISVGIQLMNETALVAGNSTIIALVDPLSGRPVLGGNITITAPNGSMMSPEVFMGKAEVLFPQAGIYKIDVTAPNYVALSTSADIKSKSDLGWLIWVVVIVLILVLVLLLMRYMGSMGGGGGKSGYRASKFKRRKPTLSRV